MLTALPGRSDRRQGRLVPALRPLVAVLLTGAAFTAPAWLPGSSSVVSARDVAPTAPGGWRWPLDGPPVVVRDFTPPPRPWLPGHRGVDLAGAEAAAVRAAGAGVVAFAGDVAGRGVLSIAHANGLRTTYEPVRPLVVAGQRVAPGDQVAALVSGHPGCPRPVCLHWGLRRGEVYLDPRWLVVGRRVRLKPLATAVPAPAQAPPVARRRAGRTRPGRCRPGPTGAARHGHARRAASPRSRAP
jgi:murein DD-endopeptidase MepM/ murein hydrolase activator NlpD